MTGEVSSRITDRMTNTTTTVTLAAHARRGLMTKGWENNKYVHGYTYRWSKYGKIADELLNKMLTWNANKCQQGVT